jgi:glc operon protein GlcG
MGITLKEAQEIIESMLKFASETKPGRPSSFAVVDGCGALISFARMDGASPLTARMAINKAYTAIDWRRDTKDIREIFFTGESKRDVAWFGEPRHAPIPGGVLLRAEDGTIVGALGSSGRTAEEDEEVVQVGAKAYQEILKNKEVQK